MSKNKKHIIPKHQYRRRRRIFSDGGQKPMDTRFREPQDNNGEEGSVTSGNDAESGSGKPAEDTSESASDERRQNMEAGQKENAARPDEPGEGPSHEIAYGSDGPAEKDSDSTDEASEEAGSSETESTGEPQTEDDRPGAVPAGYTYNDSSDGGARDETASSEDADTEDSGKSAVAAVPVGGGTGAGDDGGNGGYGNNGNNDNDNTPSDNNNNRRNRRGILSSVVIPLVAGVVGALLVFLAFSAFDDTEETGETQSSEENTEEVASTQEDLEEEQDSDREVSDSTAAIQVARESVVSVVNMQRTGSFLPEMNEQNQDPEAEPEEAGTGSGVIYKITDDSAFIVTNQHVVQDAEELQVNLQNGDSITGEIVGTDIWTDLAVLRVDRGNIDQTIPFGDSDDLLVGEEAIAIGSPLGEAFSGSVSQGIVSGLDRSVPVDLDGDGSYDWEANVIQTDAAINPGNSGGALINSDGELIGINSMKISMPMVEGIGFAIPSNEVEEIVTQIEEDGEVTRPYLGVTLQDVYTLPPEVLYNEMNLPEDVNEGVVISGVQDGSPAAGSLQQFDLVVSLDGNEVANMMELRQYLYYEKQPGDEMEIEFYRDGELQSATVTLEEG